MDSLDQKLSKLTPEQLVELDRLLLSIPDPPNYHDWLVKVSPELHWDWAWQRIMQDHFDALLRGDLEALMVEAPIRHGKSEGLTIRAPVYAIDRDRSFRFILGCYNQELANRFSRRSRGLAKRIGIPLSDERKAMSEWETTHGGGFRAVGVGAGVAGLGGNGIGIDDPIKSREDAESQLIRDKTWDWYNDDLMTRLEPKAWRFLVASPWHEDGLSGRILNSAEGKRWTHLRFPALAEPDDLVGRPEGAALCPERFTAEDLLRIKERMGAYSFAALYQCHPVPREGNMFPEGRVTIVDALPAGLKMVRYWDNAGSVGGSGARTAGVKMGCDQGRYYVADCASFREEEAERDRRQRVCAELDGKTVTQWLEQEPGSAGKAQKAVFIRFMAPYPAFAEPASGDKVVRAEGWAAQWQAGNVCLLRGDWNKAYIAEHASFPNGRTKDQVDASSGAFHKVATQKPIVGPLADLVKESHWNLG